MGDPDRERVFMSQWLAGSLAPGDRVVAGVGAATGPSPYLDLLAMLPATAVAIDGWRDYFPLQQLSHTAQGALGALSVGGALLTMLLTFRRKSIYLAVTEQQLVAVHMRGRRKPVEVLFSMPVATAELTTREGILLPLHTVWCASAGGSPLSVGGKARMRVRLTVKGRRAALDNVLTAVRLHGGAVDLPALPVSPRIR